MRAAPLPQIALALAGPIPTVLVGARRGQVQHLAQPGPAGFTATGRLRNGGALLCKRSTALTRLDVGPGRPLCLRCWRALSTAEPERTAPRAPGRAALEAALTPAELAAALNSATDMRIVTAVVAVTSQSGAGRLFKQTPGPFGYDMHLGGVLSCARARLDPASIRQRPRRQPRTAGLRAAS